ncbi:hypothetical protein KP79_PYT16127 [Mizuhopecten yessoensis]|uniref:Globin domain-containing protein n=2 Tax=Mizuhopecten yessoensis TaxID=6573 RepID=A0A210PVA2_MIZYE|nr:hypothetical protein KP79_PYT16127 [Mizuhopecten yessoensis]
MAETQQNVGALTDQEVKLLKDSWGILAEDKKTNGVKLFMKLFRRFSKAKEMFRMFKDKPLEALDYNG